MIQVRGHDAVLRRDHDVQLGSIINEGFIHSSE